MTEEECFVCGKPTGRAGRSDDSIYWADTGPWCEECSEQLKKEIEEDIGAVDEGDLAAKLDASREIAGKRLTEIVELQKRCELLDALMAAGVDNWEGYAMAQEAISE